MSLAEDLLQMLPVFTPAERQEIEKLLRTSAPLWVPQVGPQSKALESKADVLLYGGAAGGGKTDLLIGAALTQHTNAVLFRREFKQLQGVIDRTVGVLKTRDGLNTQSGVWRIPQKPGVRCKQLEFGSCQHAGDEIS